MPASTISYDGWTWEQMVQNVFGASVPTDRLKVAGPGIDWVRFTELTTVKTAAGSTPALTPGPNELLGYRKTGTEGGQDVWQVVRGWISFYDGNPAPSAAYADFYQSTTNALTTLFADGSHIFDPLSFHDAGHLLKQAEDYLTSAEAELRALMADLGDAADFQGTAAGMFLAAIQRLHADADLLLKDMTGAGVRWSDQVYYTSNDLWDFRNKVNLAWREFSDHTFQSFNTFNPTQLIVAVRTVLDHFDQGTLNAVSIDIPNTYGTGEYAGTFDLTSAAGWSSLDAMLQRSWTEQVERLDGQMRGYLTTLGEKLATTNSIIKKFTITGNEHNENTGTNGGGDGSGGDGSGGGDGGGDGGGGDGTITSGGDGTDFGGGSGDGSGGGSGSGSGSGDGSLGGGGDGSMQSFAFGTGDSFLTTGGGGSDGIGGGDGFSSSGATGSVIGGLDGAGGVADLAGGGIGGGGGLALGLGGLGGLGRFGGAGGSFGKGPNQYGAVGGDGIEGTEPGGISVLGAGGNGSGGLLSGGFGAGGNGIGGLGTDASGAALAKGGSAIGDDLAGLLDGYSAATGPNLPGTTPGEMSTGFGSPGGPGAPGGLGGLGGQDGERKRRRRGSEDPEAWGTDPNSQAAVVGRTHAPRKPETPDTAVEGLPTGPQPAPAAAPVEERVQIHGIR
ncbi:hypothetical protein [Actinoplanes sp. NPDC026619]|uniref:hypothetical protein n=1 Tax=Actinoplanes sp. NPDC026619 TaxID=3155798 RepID=UPI0033C33A3B